MLSNPTAHLLSSVLTCIWDVFVDDVDDWDFEMFQKPSEVRNDLYANNDDEEEEEGEEMEGRKVMVRRRRNSRMLNQRFST